MRLENSETQTSVPSRSPILIFMLVLMEGLDRVGGQIQRSGVSVEQRHPITVLVKSQIAELIVRHAQLVTLHGEN